MEPRDRRRCAICGESVPAGTGVCTQCGRTLVLEVPEGGASVVIDAIPSMQMRREVADVLDDWLQVPSKDALERGLSGERVHLVGGLSGDGAQTLVDALRRHRVSARVVEGAPQKGLGGAIFHPAALGVALAGLLLGFVLPVVGWVLGAMMWAGVVFWLSRQGPREALTRAPLGIVDLDGWLDAGPRMGRLMKHLPEAARGDLARMATAVAEVQSDLESGSMAAFASGGSDGALATSMARLLARGFGAAETLRDGEQEGAQVLSRVADAAEAALGRYRALADRASEGGRAEAAEKNIAAIGEAIEEAEVVVEAVQQTR